MCETGDMGQKQCRKTQKQRVRDMKACRADRIRFRSWPWADSDY